MGQRKKAVTAPHEPRPGTDPRRRSRARRVRTLRECLTSAAFCGPALVLYLGFFILPAVMGFGYSFTNWTGWGRNPDFVGLANFREIFQPDRRLMAAVKFTLFETALLVAFFTFAPLVLAVLLDRCRRVKGLLRGLFFYPYILSLLVSALLFQYLCNYREGGINTLLRSVGLASWAQDWMGDPSLVPLFIFALVAWAASGFFVTLYLASLQTVPVELYEAAAIDGAGALSVFRRIQLPMLLPAVAITSVLALIMGVNLFGVILVTTGGGPGYRTFTIGYYIYWLGVLNNRQGYASAIAFVTFVVVVVVAAVHLAVLRRRMVKL